MAPNKDILGDRHVPGHAQIAHNTCTRISRDVTCDRRNTPDKKARSQADIARHIHPVIRRNILAHNERVIGRSGCIENRIRKIIIDKEPTAHGDIPRNKESGAEGYIASGKEPASHNQIIRRNQAFGHTHISANRGCTADQEPATDGHIAHRHRGLPDHHLVRPSNGRI